MGSDGGFDFPDDAGSEDFDFDAAGDEDYDFEFENEGSEEAGEDLEVQISNCYYTSKGHIESDPREALEGFRQILDMEAEKGEWYVVPFVLKARPNAGERGFKALKQITKLEFALGDHEKVIKSYQRLLLYVPSAVPRAISEKAINSLIESVSASPSRQMLEEFYGMTLQVLKQTKNERFWFKTLLRVAKLKFEQERFTELVQVSLTGARTYEYYS